MWVERSIFCASNYLIVPSAGGKQCGAQYLFHALALVWLVAVLSWQQSARRFTLVGWTFGQTVLKTTKIHDTSITLLTPVGQNIRENALDVHTMMESAGLLATTNVSSSC